MRSGVERVSRTFLEDVFCYVMRSGSEASRVTNW